MDRMRPLFLTLTLAVVAGCQSLETPGISLAAARFAEPPVIVQRGQHYYLRYRRAVDDDGLTLLSVLYARKADDAGFYFFSVPISHVEWGCLVERPLAYDRFVDFARRGRVYWLDPDGSRHQLQVRPDA